MSRLSTFSPAFRIRPIRLEARRFARARPGWARSAREAEVPHEGRDDAVLEGEGVRQRPVQLDVGDGGAAGEVKQPRGDAQVGPLPLIAADDDARQAERGADVLRRRRAVAARPHDAPAIDDLKGVERGEVTRDRFGNTARQPRDVVIARHVREVENADLLSPGVPVETGRAEAGARCAADTIAAAGVTTGAMKR